MAFPKIRSNRFILCLRVIRNKCVLHQRRSTPGKRKGFAAVQCDFGSGKPGNVFKSYQTGTVTADKAVPRLLFRLRNGNPCRDGFPDGMQFYAVGKGFCIVKQKACCGGKNFGVQFCFPGFLPSESPCFSRTEHLAYYHRKLQSAYLHYLLCRHYNQWNAQLQEIILRDGFWRLGG